jgi:hypothetical protein
MISEHRPQIFVAETDKGWQDIYDKVRHCLTARGIPSPYFRWRKIEATDRSFARRAKRMEPAIEDGRIWFVDADWTPGVLKEFEQFDGLSKSGATRKDDSVAVASIIHDECGVKYVAEVEPEDAKEKAEQAEIEADNQRRREYHDRMFGGGGAPGHVSNASNWRSRSPEPELPPEPASTRPFTQGCNGRFALLPGAFNRKK